jgi:ABC-type multidrug transport system fused ATPase/permease subunit
VVIVAHRLETVRDCDRIYVMRAGEVIEAGTHADLVAQDGVYAELVRQQTGVAA